MGCEVYANSDEISCKAGGGKVIASFPDVCLSPPSPPAGPIPVPYPDTSFSKDMKNGSKSVKIKGKEVMLKDKSFYKSSPLGDEAATKGLGAGVITHVITGKTYFVAWSMDVKFEGQNVDRHSDITTSNHASPMANTVTPNPNLSAVAWGELEDEFDECICCGAIPRHSSGKPMSQDDWYKSDASGAPLPANHPNVVKYNALMDEVNNRKSMSPPCTCDGRVVPEEPCNVFRKPVSDAEYNSIVNTASGNSWKNYKRNQLGLPASPAADVAAVTTKYQILQGSPPTTSQLNHANQLERQGNHLVPKAAGGCPTGSNPGNVELEHNLCGRCRAIDAKFGELQAVTPRQ